MTPYPPAPWHTHGRAYLSPYLVRARDVTVPAPLEIESHFGMATGMLGYLVYETPSPLLYSELVWMPCRVKVRTDDGQTLRGFYVEKMYVDLEASLHAGRDIWALPKQLATFVERDGHVHIETEDGARLDLDVSARGFSVGAGSKMATLQVRGRDVIRFVGDTTQAKAGRGKIDVRASSGTEGFSGFAHARRLPGAGVALTPFATTMCAPQTVRTR
jgi:hypothetical protein